jgi:hypothetical protein
MPWHFVTEAGLEMAFSASHDGLIVASLVDLSGIAARAKTHGEIWHLSKRSK